MATLVGHWLKNASANDASGNGHNATLLLDTGIGSTAATAADGFRRGKCLNIPQGAYAEIPYSAGLNVGEDRSIAFWVLPRTASRTNRSFIYSERDGAATGTPFEIEIGRTNIGGDLAVGVTTPGVWRASTATGALQLDAWNFVVYTIGVVNSVLTQAIYINGSAVSLAVNSPTSMGCTSTTSRWIGAQAGSDHNSDNMLDGQLADLQLYSGVLTAREVKCLYVHGNKRAPANLLPTVSL